MVSLRVCVVQDERPRVADVQRAARVRRETEDDLPVDRIRERREFLRSGVGSDFLQEFGCDRREFRPLGLEAEFVHVRDDALDQDRGLLGPRAERPVFREHLPEDGLRVRLASVEDRVLQREFPGGFQGHVAANFLGLLSLLEEDAGARCGIQELSLMEWPIQEPLPIRPNDPAVAPGNVGPFHIAPRCLEIESWRSRRDGSINIDTDFLRETPLWKPFCTPNHILSLVGRRGAKVSLRQRAGLASAVWAVAFSLLAVVAATPKGPTAMLSVDDVTPVVGQIVHFDASGSVPHDEGKGRIVSYEFDFGDGNHTREQSSPFATHAYSLVGPKRATVDVEDARGNEGSASVRIDVQPKSPPTGAPDLTPSSASTIPAQPIEGQIAIVSIILANHGNATAEGATIDVTDQRPNGTVVSIGTASLSAPLEPEASVVVYSPTFVAIEVGNHTLDIVVGNVTPAETDLEDNTLTIGMTVLPVTGPPPGGVPDLAPESAVTIPTQPVEGEIVSVSITVVNRGSVAADAALIDISDVRPNGTIVPIGTSVLSTPLGLGDSVVVDSPSFVAAGVGDHQLQIDIRSVTPAETDVEDNSLRISMTVLPAKGPPPPPNEGGFSLDTALLAGGLAAAAVAAVLVATWLLLTPRETGPLEPPPPEPPDDSPPPIRPP